MNGETPLCTETMVSDVCPFSIGPMVYRRTAVSPALLAPPLVTSISPRPVFPSRIIPIELLEEIFRFYLAEPSPVVASTFLAMFSCGHPLEPHPTASLLPQHRSTLRSVCRYWFNVMEGSSSLWTALVLVPGMNYGAFASLLTRSHTHRLTITAYYHNESCASRGPLPNAGFDVNTELPGITEAFRQLGAAAVRWDTLTVYAEDSSIISAVSRATNSDIAMASLSSIRLLCTRNDVYPTPITYANHIPFPPFLSCRNLLLQVRAKSMSIRACRLEWGRLTPLFSKTLVNLSLDFPLGPVLAPRLFQLLSFAPNLESICLGGDFIFDPAFPSPSLVPDCIGTPISLVHLHMLALNAMSVANALLVLDHIRMPQLRSVGLDAFMGLIFHEEPNYMPFVARIIDGTSDVPWSQVTTLSVRALALRLPIDHLPDAPRFFHTFAALRELSLDFRCLQREYWKWLLVCSADGGLPMLHSVTVAGVSGLDVQDLVCIRMRAGLPRLHVVLVFHHNRRKLENEVQWSGWLRRNTHSLTVVEHTDRTFV